MLNQKKVFILLWGVVFLTTLLPVTTVFAKATLSQKRTCLAVLIEHSQQGRYFTLRGPELHHKGARGLVKMNLMSDRVTIEKPIRRAGGIGSSERTQSIVIEHLLQSKMVYLIEQASLRYSAGGLREDVRRSMVDEIAEKCVNYPYVINVFKTRAPQVFQAAAAIDPETYQQDEGGQEFVEQLYLFESPQWAGGPSQK